MSKLEECILGDLVEFQRGYDLPKSKLVEGKYPVQSSNGILGYHNEYKVEGPGITIGRSGTVGNPHLIRENFFPHNTSLFVKDFKGNDIEYIYYFLQYLDLGNQKSGSGVPTMNRNHLHPIKIRAYRDKTCQQRTIKILSLIDKKIQINDQINQELEALAKTLYDYWFVQFDFPDQNGKPYKSSGRKMVYNPELKREIPEGWGVEKLDDLGTIVGGSTPTKSISDNFTKGGEGYSWITPNDLSNNKGNKFIKNGEIDVTVRGLKDASLKLYPEGTVLMSSRAPVGYLAIATKELTTNQGFKSFIPDKKYDKNYIYYTLQNCLKVIEQNASNGSIIKYITIADVNNISSPYDHNVVDEFVKIYRPLIDQISKNKKQNQELTQLRDWLLPMLMNGQVKVE